MRISDWSSDVCSSDLNRHYVELAQQEGGRLVTGGEALRLAAPGYYMSPALIADTDPAMRINTEEVFGPVVSTVRIKNYDDALALANRGTFGLSAGIATTPPKTAPPLPPPHPPAHGSVHLPTPRRPI